MFFLKHLEMCTLDLQIRDSSSLFSVTHLPVQNGHLPVSDGVDTLQPSLPLIDQTGHVLHRIVRVTYSTMVTAASQRSRRERKMKCLVHLILI